MSTVFALKGNTNPSIPAAFSSTALLIRGNFWMSGRQPIGEAGGCPTWVAKVFEDDPAIQEIAVNYKDMGIVYHRGDADAEG